MSEPIEELLQAYLDGELEAEARADLERRVMSEPALKDELDRLSFARDAVTGLPRAEAPLDLADEVLRRVQETTASAGRVSSSSPPSSTVPSSTAPWPMAWRAAAAIALLLLPASSFMVGYRVGITRGPEMALAPEATPASAPALFPAADGPSDFLVLLHGNAGAGELGAEQRSWRDLQYTNWADSLMGTGRLVRADDLSDDSGRGVWADGNVNEGEVWFASSRVVPTRAYVLKAWDYDQALDIARTSPHLAFGGSVTVRRIAESP